MQVVINHENGQQYCMKVNQVVVYNDDGLPVAITYEHAGLIVHTDVTQDDFDSTCRTLCVTKLEDNG